MNLISYISQKKNGSVEWEDIISSRGLISCYEFESKDTRSDTISFIENNMNDPVVIKALTTHFKFLMRFARMCAIAFKCKSVFIHYSVFQDCVSCLQKHAGLCRDEFMHFTKSEWVSNVSVFIQSSQNNLSSNGVMYHALLRALGNEAQEDIEDLI